jgi:divalent metal cation (Fe/Co/Zn/Cd) transporter
MGVWAAYLQSATSTTEARRGCGFGLLFIALGIWSFVVSEISIALVLQLNAFQLLYRGLCTLGHYGSAELGRKRPDSGISADFPFGLARLDQLVQFAAAAMLVFASLSVTVEGIHHLLEVHDTKPWLVEVVCCCHLASICAFTLLCRPVVVRFQRGSKLLFWAFECRAPLICFVSCASVTYFKAPRIDVVCSIIFAFTCVFAAASQLRSLAPVLLLEAPDDPDRVLGDSLRQISIVDGVKSVSRAQVWRLRPDVAGVALKVVVSPECDHDATLRKIRRVMDRVSSRCTIELEAGEFAPSISTEVDLLPRFPAPPVRLQFPV